MCARGVRCVRLCAFVGVCVLCVCVCASVCVCVCLRLCACVCVLCVYVVCVFCVLRKTLIGLDSQRV